MSEIRFPSLDRRAVGQKAALASIVGSILGLLLCAWENVSVVQYRAACGDDCGGGGGFVELMFNLSLIFMQFITIVYSAVRIVRGAQDAATEIRRMAMILAVLNGIAFVTDFLGGSPE